MKKTFLIGIIVVAWMGSVAQIAKTVEVGDSSYTYSDADYELLNAAAEGDTSKMRAFLDLGTDVNTSTWEGVTPLMFAAQNGHLVAVEFLIDAGAQINRKPYNQIDALLGSVIAGHVLVADTLILNGADVNTRNLYGVTPLMVAAAFNHYLLCDVLMFYGAKVNTTDNYRNYPIHFSAFYGNTEITDLLLSGNALIDCIDFDGFTPLMVAAQNGHLPQVMHLVDKGSTIDKTNENNCTALTLAILNNRKDVAGYLLEQGAAPNHAVTEKANHYEIALEHAGEEMTGLLAEYGATPMAKFRVRKMLIHADVNWNNKDVMMGGSIGLLESVHGWEAEAGYRTRPWTRSVRFEHDQNVYYQFWETRSLFYLGAGKRWALANSGPREQYGAFASANLGYTYGNLRGSNRKPDDVVIFIPKAGLFYTKKALNIRVNYEYMKFPDTNISPHRINVSLGVVINLIKTNFKSKKEPAL